MTNEEARVALGHFAKSVRLDRRANPGVAGDGTALELLLAPRFHVLLETMLAQLLARPPRVLPEYRRAGIGRPDLAFAHAAQPARAFVELKEPGKALDPRRWRGHDADQFRRFGELPLWALCNFHTLILYRRHALVEQVTVLPAAALDPATADAVAERLIGRVDSAAFMTVLETLALAPAYQPRTAAEMATGLAQAARLVRQVVLDQCRAGAPPALDAVRSEFRETLFAHAAAGGFDVSDENDLFANAFAQTLTFGMMLARDAAVGTENDAAKREKRQARPVAVDRDAYRVLPAGIYGLLRTTLQALTEDQILQILGAAFDIVQDTVNAADPALLTPRGGRDPILYFYEDFLEVFDPAARKRHGVFFTPVQAVRFMVAATDRALRDGLATQGLLDKDVMLLDPACGTGTFLVAAAAHAAETARTTWGDGAVANEVAALAGRLHGFEMLVGPYTVAHYRMLREVAAHGGVPSGRLPIYLADTLRPPTGAVGVTSRLGYMAAPIMEERRAADELKRDTPILAIIGNPPYRRLAEGEEEALVAGWDNGFWSDLKAPVRRAGWGGELNTFPDLYIAFWRWCLWKLFDSNGAPGRGVVCLITNRTFLAGHPYAGLRQMMRRRFDSIDIVDLRGDSRGALPAGIETDENIFAIQTGVCILIAVASGRPRVAGVEARVRYADAWRHATFTGVDKLALLDQALQNPEALSFVKISRGGVDDFMPGSFEGLEWPALSECFEYRGYGAKSQHDDIAYDFSDACLLRKLRAFQAEADLDRARQHFKDSRKNKTETALASVLDPSLARKVSFRPFDRRCLYYHPQFVDEMARRPASVWGADNVGFYAMPSGTGAGPAVWAHGLLPDYHAFRGSYGGYAFPLWDRRQPGDTPNITPVLLAGLAVAYGRPVTPEAVFNAIAALLSATSYTRRFASDLEEAFAHVPFPAEYAAFLEAVRIGAEIQALETFARPPAAAFHSATLIGRHAAGATLAVPPIGRAFLEDGSEGGFVALQADQSFRLAALPERVWTFAVSGYRVLPRWLAARQGEVIDSALQRALLDVAWRIDELLHWFDAADAVLARAVAAPLTRAGLGLPSPLRAGPAENEPEGL